MTVRVRFAPSPTGYLHVGGARTALFNWLYARRVGGKFLLRIEDTDRARSSDEHTRIIKEGLAWLGLDWDEDIVFQGARLARHQEVARRLLKDDKAYEEEGAIRLRVPPGELAWDDAVHRRISFRGEDVRDFPILRSDGSPLYNFAVVVDDLDMRITHVLRGDDHISNTPKQLAVYRALGAEPPIFGHVPMLNGADGKKLSKRHGATAVGDYQHFGILPSAMRNFLALLGWSPGNDRELFFSIDELVNAFTIEGIQRKSAIFDMVKLQWMNSEHMRHLSGTDRDALLREVLAVAPDLKPFEARAREVLPIVVQRCQTTTELASQLRVRLNPTWQVELDEQAKTYVHDHPDVAGILEKLTPLLQGIPKPSWASPATLEPQLQQIASTLGQPTGSVFQPLRIAATGSTVSEPIHELLWAVGSATTLSRVRSAPAWLQPAAGKP